MDAEVGDSKILDVLVEDNGSGFTEENRASFDTLYSDRKILKGGKGFGRFTCLRYFEDVWIDSTYRASGLRRRQFEMGKENELIVNERLSDPIQDGTGTTITLVSERTGKLPRKLSSLARGLVELLLPYFSTKGYVCPRIELSELDGTGLILLNDYVDSPGAIIHEVSLPNAAYTLQGTAGPQIFEVRVFKFLSPQNKVSKLSLVAHKREVTETSLASYIPEFADEFVEDPGGDQSRRRNYILKAYVFGPYLDDNVLLERGSFSFHKETDLLLGISQTQIESQAAEQTKAAVLDQVATRQERKRERLQQYVEEQAPWYKSLMKSVDTSALPSTASDTEIEALLHREQFKQEVQVRQDVASVLASDDPNQILQRARELADRVSESSKNELVHYVALRGKCLRYSNGAWNLHRRERTHPRVPSMM